MQTIKTLPDHLINQIAAGEVIERPSSVVKECLENSVDAGARYVTLELEDGGQSLIRITDDGKGMHPEDAKMAFERHATSKISNQDDLENIQTMGFRGEALASIASVALCRLVTRVSSHDAASELIIEASKIQSFNDAAFQVGTQIEIRNLFFNTPARRKYMKSPAAEYKSIIDFVTQFALSHPKIGIKVIHNGKQTIDYSPCSGENLLADRALQVFGAELASNLIPVEYSASHMKVYGFIGKTIIARKSRAGQFLFVNKRPLGNTSISFAVRDAYGSILRDGHYPFFILFLDLDPAFVDVNVHPRKLEVRFLSPREVFSAVKSACNRALDEANLAPSLINPDTGEIHEYKTEMSNAQGMRLSDMTVPYGRYEKFGSVPRHSGQTSSSSRTFSGDSFSKASVEDAINFTKEFIGERAPAGIEDELSMTPLAQIADSYILAQSENGIVLIDQHAAHERVLFEKFMKSFEEKEEYSQALLSPLSINLSHQEALLLKDNLEIFSGMGFDIEEFGEDTFVLRAVPLSLIKSDAAELVKSVLDDITEEKTVKKARGRREEILTSMACRSAIMFGDKLSQAEMIGLVKEIDKTDQPYTCPHGRPSMFTLSFSELEKKFGRRGF